MASVVRGDALGVALKAEGLIPDNCDSVSLEIRPSALIHLNYTVIVGIEDLPKIARALEAVAEANNR